MVKDEQITGADARFIHWLERITIPLVVASILAGATWMFDVSGAVGENAAALKSLSKGREDNSVSIAEFKENQESLKEDVHKIEKNVVEIKGNQKRFEEDIHELKELQRDILKELRDNGRSSGR